MLFAIYENKTDIIYFTNAHKPNSQNNYKSVEIKNTGMTLDDYKNKKERGNNDCSKDGKL